MPTKPRSEILFCESHASVYDKDRKKKRHFAGRSLDASTRTASVRTDEKWRRTAVALEVRLNPAMKCHFASRAQRAALAASFLGSLFVLAGCTREPINTANTSPQPASEPERDPGAEARPSESESAAGDAASSSATVNDPVVAKLVKQREMLDRTLWRDEVLAQEYEGFFVKLWDQIRGADNRFAALMQSLPDKLVVPALGETDHAPWGMEFTPLSGEEKSLTKAEARAAIEELAARGYVLEEVEFHHSAFERPTPERPAESVVSFVLHVANASRNERIVVRGNLNVTWADGETPAIVAVQSGRLMRRVGAPAFREVARFEYDVDATNRTAPGTPHPFIARDLNRDGLTDLISGSFNEVNWNQGAVDGKVSWVKERLVDDDVEVDVACAGLFADFNGDGRDDLVLGMNAAAPRVFLADEDGKFTGQAIPITLPEMMILPTTVTAGDVDGDGDLDLWIGQYKPPYTAGNMPTPYYDANDGFPSYLLLGDGTGRFTDATAESGLADKRFRRNFSGSLVDLNGDGALDLITVADFAGYDLSYGDGGGHFRDVTGEAVPDLDAFGMAHTLGDYNRDGLIDVYVIGMSSTTARRLENLGVGRKDFAAHTAARPGMGYGNRLLLGDGAGGFVQAPFNDQIARTGWSWGTTTFDVDNDGAEEIYVCNGHTSGESCRDYCTTFWTHDIYAGGSTEDVKFSQLFANVLSDVRDHEISWNGFEHNVLWFNRGGASFENIAYLMGVGFEFDCRSALSDDVDADGRVDLIVEESDWRTHRHTFHVLRNEWPTDHHWIGLNLYESGPGRSPLGAVVVCKTADRELKEFLASGHSTTAQHSNRVHFGLGATDAVEYLEVRWPSGETTRIDAPAIDAYHMAPAHSE